MFLFLIHLQVGDDGEWQDKYGYINHQNANAHSYGHWSTCSTSGHEFAIPNVVSVRNAEHSKEPCMSDRSHGEQDEEHETSITDPSEATKYSEEKCQDGCLCKPIACSAKELGYDMPL